MILLTVTLAVDLLKEILLFSLVELGGTMELPLVLIPAKPVYLSTLLVFFQVSSP